MVVMADTADDDDDGEGPSMQMMPRPVSSLSYDERRSSQLAAMQSSPRIAWGEPERYLACGKSVNRDGGDASLGGGSSSAAGAASALRPTKCTWFFGLRILDTVLLLLVCIAQGSLLNFLIIWHRQKSHAVYLWFLADFTVVMAFVGALTTSYQRMLRRGSQSQLQTKSGSSVSVVVVVHQQKRLPPYGALPLGYLSWLGYSCTLVAKIVTIFTRGIDDHLGEEGVFDSQILKMVIGGGACIVFLLLVNGHRPPLSVATPAAYEGWHSYVASLCMGTAFEIFDAVAFLEVLFVEESRVVLPFPLENAILVLSSINLVLPTVTLLRLSLADFGVHDRSVVLALVYTSAKLLLIEVPYLVIRAYLWQGYGASTTSIFMLKNILMIAVKLRYIIPEYVALLVAARASATAAASGDADAGASASTTRGGDRPVELKTIS